MLVCCVCAQLFQFALSLLVQIIRTYPTVLYCCESGLDGWSVSMRAAAATALSADPDIDSVLFYLVPAVKRLYEYAFNV